MPVHNTYLGLLDLITGLEETLSGCRDRMVVVVRFRSAKRAFYCLQQSHCSCGIYPYFTMLKFSASFSAMGYHAYYIVCFVRVGRPLATLLWLYRSAWGCLLVPVLGSLQDIAICWLVLGIPRFFIACSDLAFFAFWLWRSGTSLKRECARGWHRLEHLITVRVVQRSVSVFRHIVCALRTSRGFLRVSSCGL